jgi:hypothetical protein
MGTRSADEHKDLVIRTKPLVIPFYGLDTLFCPRRNKPLGPKNYALEPCLHLHHPIHVNAFMSRTKRTPGAMLSTLSVPLKYPPFPTLPLLTHLRHRLRRRTSTPLTNHLPRTNRPRTRQIPRRRRSYSIKSMFRSFITMVCSTYVPHVSLEGITTTSDSCLGEVSNCVFGFG